LQERGEVASHAGDRTNVPKGNVARRSCVPVTHLSEQRRESNGLERAAVTQNLDKKAGLP
jgi:hypothetical protein